MTISDNPSSGSRPMSMKDIRSVREGSQRGRVGAHPERVHRRITTVGDVLSAGTRSEGPREANLSGCSLMLATVRIPTPATKLR
jgi:hypothetical protein